MRKLVNITLWTIVFSAFLAMTVSAENTQESNIMDNIEIIAIESIHAQSGNLTLVTQIKNSNKEEIKLTEGAFTFYLRTDKTEDEEISKDEELGSDNRDREIFLKTTEKLMNEEGKDFNEVIFEIDLGKNPQKIIRSLERIINAVGNSSNTNPVFYIKGNFYLGVKSDKGWSSVRAKINWVFRPELQKRVLLKASLDLPVPDFPKNKIEAIDIIIKKCRVSEDIKFKLDSDKLTDESKKILDKYIDIFSNDFPSEQIVIAGHTCELGKTEYNLELSQKRAEAVKNYFIQNGIHSDRLKTEAYGEDMYDKAKGLPWNRRVEFICEECCQN